MNCENCGAAMRFEAGRNYLVCGACGSFRHVEPNADGVLVLNERSERRCPVCRTPLTAAAIEGQRVLHCEKCRGILVGVEEFVFVAARLGIESGRSRSAPARFMESELTRAIDCPLCSRPMDTHPYAGPGCIVIDNCPRCGVNWLDYRELRRVADAASGSEMLSA